MNAAGMSPWVLFRGFFAAAIVVSIFVGFVSAYLSPDCLQKLRRWSTNVRADVVANIMQPGKFLQIERGLMVHIRERGTDNMLLGILVDDQRNPKRRRLCWPNGVRSLKAEAALSSSCKTAACTPQVRTKWSYDREL
jgi:lipopolysaccharide export system permease protein